MSSLNLTTRAERELAHKINLLQIKRHKLQQRKIPQAYGMYPSQLEQYEEIKMMLNVAQQKKAMLQR